jgi:PAS domain S-box-containing protein
MSKKYLPTILYYYNNQHDLNEIQNLTGNYYKIIGVTSIDEIDEMFSNKKIMMVIADMILKDFNGLDILNKIKDKKPRVGRIVIATDYDEDKTIDLIYKNIIHGFITKPFNKIQILSLFNLNTQRYFLDESSKVLVNEINDIYGSYTKKLNQIDEEVEKQKKLADINKYLAAIIDNTEDHAVIKDTNLRWIAANKSVIESVGKKDISEVIGKTDIELFGDHPHVRKYLSDDQYALTLKKGQCFEDEEVVIGADGVKRYKHVKKFPIFDENGKVIATANISRDITARREVEEKIKNLNEELAAKVEERTKELSQSNLLLRKEIEERKELEDKLKMTQNAIDNNTTPVFWLSNEGKFLYTNNAFTETIGYDNNELKDKKFCDFIYKQEDSHNKWDEFYSKLKVHKTTNFIIELVKKSKKRFIAEIKLDYHIYEDKEYLFAYLTDITEKIKLENEIKRLAIAVEQSPFITVITDVNGEIEYVNPKFTEITGYQFDEVIGQNPRILKSGKIPIEIYENLWDTILKGKVWKGELCNKKKNGDLYWEYGSIASLRNEKGEIINFIKISEDITEKRKMTEELIRAKEEAESANKAKSEFLANMSHEIRTPIHAILGFTDMLLKITNDNRHINYLESIRNNSKSLLNIINDVLDLSKIEAGKLTFKYHFVDAYAFLTEISGMFIFRAKEKGIEFIIDISPSVPAYIYIDDIRLRQVLVNLLGNALKFTEKGYIKLSVQSEKYYSEIKIDEEINYVDLLFIIEDTGIGMSDEFKQKVFQSFSQDTHKSGKKYEGTGLGLAISKRLTEMMNGEIWFESEKDKGTKFFVRIKKVENYSTLAKIDSEGFIYDDIVFKGSKVFIVDDIESNRNFLSALLKDKNLEIFEAANGQECLELLKQEKPDLIITDLKMPLMDGFELFENLKKNIEYSKIPIIAASATYSESPQIRQNYKFDAIIFKPIKLNTVFEEIMKILPYSIKAKTFTIEADKEKEKITMTNDEYNAYKKIIEDEILPEWEIIHQQESMEEIEKFSKKIKETGEKYNLSILIQYSESLFESINMFDIAKMLKLINSFPELLKEIDTNIEKVN